MINVVKNQLPKFLPAVVSGLVNPRLDSIVHDTLQKKQIVPALSSATLAQPANKAAESLFELELKNILFAKMDKIRCYLTHEKHQELYDSLLKSIMLDEAIAKGDVNPDNVLKKQDRDDDQDEDPSAGPNQGKKTKRRRTKEYESPRCHLPQKTHPKVIMDDVDNMTNDDVVNDNDQPQHDSVPKTNTAPKNDWFKQPRRPPSLDPEWNKVKAVDDTQEQTWFNDLLFFKKDPLTFNKLMVIPIDFSKFVMNRLKIDKLTKADLVGPVYNLLKGTCQSSIELEYNMEECYKALTNQLDWENSEGDRCPFDLNKPLPLKGHLGHLTIAVEYFFNNDLEYLKSIDSKRIAAKVGYDKDVERGIKHWGPKHQLYYRSQINRLSKHSVYSTLKILSVVRVKVDKQFGYWYLEKIVVRRVDRQLYTFKEGDFINLRLNEIEDMLLLVAQHKLFHLDGDAIVDLAVALRMFTIRIVIKKRVEDVQLGVESYQKKLNITRPQKNYPTISTKEPYTPSFDPPWVVYEDLSNKKRLI
ncbi:hypothetical protein Tco_1418612 [Tanacetum coccineum]